MTDAGWRANSRLQKEPFAELQTDTICHTIPESRCRLSERERVASPPELRKPVPCSNQLLVSFVESPLSET